MIRALRVAGLASAFIFVGVCTAPVLTPSPSVTLIPPFVSSPLPTTCHARGPLPDPVCTPGALNPRVTQATIGSTICVAGWTGTIRPPTSYTNALKLQQMAAYGDSGMLADYEEDHFVALELGGDPRDPLNLWPQPRTPVDGAAAKDALENQLHRLVCAGTLTLADAQRCIIVDWVACSRRIGP